MSPRARSWWKRLLGTIVLPLVLALATAAGLLLHVGLPPSRRFVAGLVERALNAEFQGHFELRGIERLTTRGFRVATFDVYDPGGVRVLRGEGIRGRADAWAILRAIFVGSGDVTIVVEHGRAERVAVSLLPDAEGKPTIAAAFAPRRPSTGGGRDVRVWMPSLELERGELVGRMAFAPKLEGRVRGARGSVLVAPAGVAVDAPQFAAVINGLLPGELRAVGSFHQRGTSHFWTTLDGYVGDVQYDSVLRLDGKRLQASVDLPSAEPAAVRALLPSWPLRETVSVRAKATGDLPALRVQGTMTIGGAELTAEGDLDLEDEPHAELKASGTGLDVSAVIDGAPVTAIDARAELDIRATPAGVVVEGDGETDPAAIAGVPLPASRFHGRYDASGFAGTVTLEEEGVPLDARFRIVPGGAIELEAHAKRFRIENAPRVKKLLDARGGLELDAKARIDQGILTASFVADGRELATGSLRAGTLKVDGKLVGPIADPRALVVSAKASAGDLVAGPFRIDTGEAEVKGPVRDLTIAASLVERRGAQVTVRTRLGVLDGTRLDGLEVDVARGGAVLKARAERVVLDEQSLEVRDARIEGAGGTLIGSANVRPGLAELALRGDDVDLDAISRVLGLSSSELGGKLRISSEVAIARDVKRATLDLSVRNGRVGPLRAVTFDGNATLSDRSLAGEARADVAGLGSIRASFDTELAGSALAAESYRRATGRIDLGLERLDLSQVALALPESLGVRHLTGMLTAQTTLLRSDAARLPTLKLLAATDGLAFDVKRDEPGQDVEIRGIEAQLSADADTATGLLDASLRLIDDDGLLVTAGARLESDMGRLLAVPGDLAAELSTSPVIITAKVEGRRLERLPEPVRPEGSTGVLFLEATLRGTLKEPVLSAKGSVASLVVGDDARPFDVCGRVQYDPSVRRIGLGAEVHLPASGRGACSGRRVALATATGVADLPAIARGERGFVGDAELALENTPLELVPALAEAGIAGTVDGRVAMLQTDDLPRVTAALRLEGGAVGTTSLGSGELDLRSDGRVARATLVLASGEGKLAAEGRAGISWDGLVPGLDPTQPVLASTTIANVDAVVLGPLLRDVLSDLTGRLDGAFKVSLVPRGNGQGYGGDVTGKATLREGAFQLRGLDMRLSRVSFDAEARKVGGRTVIFVRGMKGASRSEHENIAATADLYLEGLTLTGGRANVNLREVPFLIAGVSKATLSGSASLAIERRSDRMHVAVVVPELTAELPRSSGHEVLAVDAHPDIEILQPIAEPTHRRRGESDVWELSFELGRKVRVKRADLDLRLRGRPVVTLADEVAITGDVELLPGGRAQVLGKVFTMESGEAHFDTGEATNPRIRVLASWRASDGTTIYLEVRGTYREATLTLRSDPPRTEQEIQALLLGGSSETGDAGAAGISYGTDFLAEVLAETPLQGVQIRTSNERGVDDRTYATWAAAVQISDEIWFEGSYKSLESQGPGQQGGYGVSGTVDWRFRRNWSLRTEVGNIGAGLDVVWQYRY
jgi:translocation and assembly module TamB